MKTRLDALEKDGTAPDCVYFFADSDWTEEDTQRVRDEYPGKQLMIFRWAKQTPKEAA